MTTSVSSDGWTERGQSMKMKLSIQLENQCIIYYELPAKHYITQ